MRSYKTKEGEIFDVNIDFNISFAAIYKLGLAPDDVLAEVIKETDDVAKEIYGAEPVM